MHVYEPTGPRCPAKEFYFTLYYLPINFDNFFQPIFLNEISLSTNQSSNILNDAFSATNSSKKSIGNRKPSTGFGDADKNENVNNETTLELELYNQVLVFKCCKNVKYSFILISSMLVDT